MESTAQYDDSLSSDFVTGPFNFEIEKPLLFGEVFHIAQQ